MKNHLRCLESKDIETNCNPIFNQKLPVRKYAYIQTILQDIWTKLQQALLVDPNELKVWKKVDRQGNNYWVAYDPKTEKSFASGSEADVCLWIEQISKSYNYGRTDFSNW